VELQTRWTFPVARRLCVEIALQDYSTTYVAKYQHAPDVFIHVAPSSIPSKKLIKIHRFF